MREDAGRGIWERSGWRALAQLIVCAAAGVLAGVVWVSLAPRAHYLVGEDLHATMSERAYAEIIGGDAMFVIITAIVGTLLGLLTWAWFSRRSWHVVVLSVLGALVMTLTAWPVGELIGGSGLTDRIAMANVGDYVQMDLVLHAHSALAVGPFFAITPVMLLSAFLPERSVDAPESEGDDG